MKKTVACLLISLFLVSLGCHQQPDRLQSTSATQAPQTTAENLSRDTETQHLQQSADDRQYKNVRFDDAGNLPEVSSVRLYARDFLPFAPDDIVKAFSPYTTVSYRQRDDGRIKFSTSAKGTDVSLFPGWFVYETSDDENINRLFYDDENSDDYNTELFASGEELPFLSRNEAENQFVQIVSQLGISEKLGSHKIYTLTADSLDTAIENRCKSAEQTREELFDYKFFPECYVITAPLAKDGVPILFHTIDYHTKDWLINRTYVRAILSEKGLIHFSVTGYYFGEPLSEEHAPISLDEAKNRVDGVFDLLILSEPIRITKTQMCYVPTEDTLIPAYGFCYAQDDGLPLWIYINAITGEQII